MTDATLAKSWFTQYPFSIPAEIDVSAYANLAEMLEAALTKYADLVAFHCSGTDVTYRELDRLSTAFAVHLAKLGFKKSDRFALMMPNVPQYPVALMGCLRLGLTVFCNSLDGAREQAH